MVNWDNPLENEFWNIDDDRDIANYLLCGIYNYSLIQINNISYQIKRHKETIKKFNEEL